MVLGKLPVPGHPTIRMMIGQGPIALAVGVGGGLFGHFFLLYPFSPLPPSLWETARYRLKSCLKGPLNSKQPARRRHVNTIFIQLNTPTLINAIFPPVPQEKTLYIQQLMDTIFLQL